MTPTPTSSTANDHTARIRALGALAILGALCYIAAGIVFAAVEEGEAQTADGVLTAAWAAGAVAGLVAIGLLGVAGRSVLARLALTISLLAYAVAALDGVLFAADLYEPDESAAYAISRLASVIGMLLLGIATVTARRWQGWRRISPFAIPLAVPVAAIGMAVSDSLTVAMFVGAAWLAIGTAIVTTAAGDVADR